MIFDASANDTFIYRGKEYVRSQFVVEDLGEIKVSPILIYKVDTEKKRIYFSVPENGDLTVSKYKGGLKGLPNSVYVNGKQLIVSLPYTRIRIALYDGNTTPSDYYEEPIVFNEEMLEDYKGKVNGL